MQKRRSKNVTTKNLSNMLILLMNNGVKEIVQCAYTSNWFWNKSTLPELMSPMPELMSRLPGLMSKEFPLLLWCFYFSPMCFAY
jgi:hypothetical protein